jgi:hypothetical protein
MNGLDSLFFFEQIFNPISFTITSLEERNFTFINYNDYLREIDKNQSLRNINPNLTDLLKTIINTNNNSDPIMDKEISYAVGNYTEIANVKMDILGDLVNYALLSIFLIIAAMLTFELRNFNNDWRVDMGFYFLVSFTLINYLFLSLFSEKVFS